MLHFLLEYMMVGPFDILRLSVGRFCGLCLDTMDGIATTVHSDETIRINVLYHFIRYIISTHMLTVPVSDTSYSEL